MAGVQVRIEVDAAPALALLEALSSPDLEQVAALAINDTLKNAQVQAARVIAPAMGAPSAAVKAAISIELARSDALTGALVARGKPLKMILFKTRPSQPMRGRRPPPGGVSVRIGPGPPEVYRHAFIARMPTGHVGVFQRTAKGLRELYGASVPGYMARSDVLPVIQATLSERLVANLTRQLDRRMRRNANKHKGKG
jgi:Prophage minor tail protein Z (GPZ)